MSNIPSVGANANSVTSTTNSTANSGNSVANPTNTGATTDSNASTLLGSNFNTFLTLLTTQLQNQDPLSPLDSNQFTQQLVEFSQVEQQINTNGNLTNLITLQGQNNLIGAQSLVGQSVELNAAQAPLVDGQAAYSYTLPSTAASTTLAVTNSAGAVVWSGAGQTAAGSYNFTWNGEDMNGNSQPAGNYTLNVLATDSHGATITPTIAAYGTVDSVSSQNGTTNLTIDGASYPLSDLAGVTPSPS